MRARLLCGMGRFPMRAALPVVLTIPGRQKSLRGIAFASIGTRDYCGGRLSFLVMEDAIKTLAKAVRRIVLFGSVFVLVGCGARAGVGQDETPGSPGGPILPAAPAPVVTNFTAVAMAGEVLTYSLDATNLTYSYTITDSQFGLAGKTGSGTLVKNSDGTYSPAGISNAKVIVLPNGLLLAWISTRPN